MKLLVDNVATTKGPFRFFRSLPMITPGPFVASWPKEFLRQPGIEPGSIAWEATMLTITPLTQRDI